MAGGSHKGWSNSMKSFKRRLYIFTSLWPRLTHWAATNQKKIHNFQCALYIFIGAGMMVFACQIGRTHISVLQGGIKTQGKIVASKIQPFSTAYPNSTRVQQGTISLPIIEFQVGDTSLRFKDWIGEDSSYSDIADPVPIIYSAENPSVAIVDRPIVNWLSWAPIFVIGLLLVLWSIKNLYVVNFRERG